MPLMWAVSLWSTSASRKPSILSLEMSGKVLGVTHTKQNTCYSAVLLSHHGIKTSTSTLEGIRTMKISVHIKTTPLQGKLGWLRWRQNKARTMAIKMLPPSGALGSSLVWIWSKMRPWGHQQLKRQNTWSPGTFSTLSYPKTGSTKSLYSLEQWASSQPQIPTFYYTYSNHETPEIWTCLYSHYKICSFTYSIVTGLSQLIHSSEDQRL